MTMVPARSACSAIVLAGGAASRFGGDKLASELDGKPLLHHAVDVVATIASEVLIAGPPSPAGAASMPADLSVPVTIVTDSARHQGPLAATVDAASRAAEPILLVVGGDMPTLRPRLLGALLDAAVGRDGACLVAGGWIQPLPVALDRERALDIGTRLSADGERSLRQLVVWLDVAVLAEETWRRHDPDGSSLRDVDTPDDLRDASVG